MNKVFLLGNLGADAELKVTQGGQVVLKFSLATTEKWKNRNDEMQEKTNWHRCALWGKRAEALAPHLKKGSRLFVEGSVEYSSYEKDGEKRYSTDIKVTNIEFAGGKSQQNRENGESAPPSVGDELPPVGDDEIPF